MYIEYVRYLNIPAVVIQLLSAETKSKQSMAKFDMDFKNKFRSTFKTFGDIL